MAHFRCLRKLRDFKCTLWSEKYGTGLAKYCTSYILYSRELLHSGQRKQWPWPAVDARIWPSGFKFVVTSLYMWSDSLWPDLLRWRPCMTPWLSPLWSVIKRNLLQFGKALAIFSNWVIVIEVAVIEPIEKGWTNLPGTRGASDSRNDSSSNRQMDCMCEQI